MQYLLFAGQRWSRAGHDENEQHIETKKADRDIYLPTSLRKFWPWCRQLMLLKEVFTQNNLSTIKRYCNMTLQFYQGVIKYILCKTHVSKHITYREK